jgi:hypothetical protein
MCFQDSRMLLFDWQQDVADLIRQPWVSVIPTSSQLSLLV